MAENFFGITDTGKRREKNEDTFIAEAVSNDEFIAACVIDGVGGYTGGEVAADLARSTILEHTHSFSGEILVHLKNAIIAANDRIYKEKQVSKKNDKMACVLTYALADVKNNKFYFAHVGDTRLYLLRDKTLVKVTRDHSVIGFLEETGRLSEEEAMRHPKRNEINKALGFEAQIHSSSDFIETGESPFLPGDMILLCSDGLSDMIGNNIITSILTKENDLSTKAHELVDAANDAGGKDNITVVLVENNRLPQQHITSIPSLIKKNEIKEKDGLTDKKQNEVQNGMIQKKSNSGLVGFLVILSIALAGGFLFILFKDSAKKEKEKIQDQKAIKTKSEKERLLLEGINDSAKIFALSSTDGILIPVSDSIRINNDSLHIIGNGITLKSDSAYRGPGLIISPSSKHILLDSLILENFDVAIIVQNNNLVLKNIRFVNCRVPIQYQLLLADSNLISGRLIDTIFFKSSPAK